MLSKATVILAASLASVANAGCSVTPTTSVTDFDQEQFAGTWFMQSSTFYGNDEFGCVKMTISSENERQLLDASVRAVLLWSVNPTQTGKFVSWQYSVSATDAGAMSYSRLGFSSDWYKVIDTDYENYAIVYECTRNNPMKILNYKSDNLHIFTRSETVTDTDLETYKTAALAAADGITGFEDIEHVSCLPISNATKYKQLFTDPDTFFRKW